jgi:LmbE family N-acetylglucosaminyl deacetylase
VVVTVFSSGPVSSDSLSLWDRECGSFEPGDNVPAIREGEDDDALGRLGASALRFGFWDEQYRATSASLVGRARRRATRALGRAGVEPGLLKAVSGQLSAMISESSLKAWFAPLGVRHGDHELTTAAFLLVAREMQDRQWFIYDDLPYAREQVDEAATARRRIADAGFTLEEASAATTADASRKRDVIACYRSQLRGLGSRADTAILGPERYYLLVDGAGSASASHRA